MTERKIIFALKKIEKCKQRGYYAEALLEIYFLNLDVLHFLSHKFTSLKADETVKAKHLLENLMVEVGQRANLKTIINKKNLKAVKPWLNKMDAFFKTIKCKKPANIKALLAEGEKVFGILKISATKLLISLKK